MTTRRRQTAGIIREALERRRREEADVRPRRVVGAAGVSRHVLEARDGGPPFIASGPGFTYRPGAVVPTASHSNIDPREILLAQSAARGASEYPAIRATGQTAASLDPCEIVTGKSYIGIRNDSGADELHAWRYTDGAYQEDVAILDYSSEGWSSLNLTHSKAVLASGAVYFLAPTPGASPWELARWTLATNTLDKLVLGDEDWEGPIIRGSTVYLMHLDSFVSELYSSNLALATETLVASFDWEPEFSASGFPLSQFAILASSGELCRGTDFTDQAWAAFGGSIKPIDGSSDETFVDHGYPGTLGGESRAVRFRQEFGDPENSKRVQALAASGLETNLWPAQWSTESPGDVAEVRVAPGGLQYVFYSSDAGDLYRGPIVDASAESCSWPGVTVEAHPTEAELPSVMLPED